MTDLYKLTQDMLDLERELAEATDPETGAVNLTDEKMGDFFRLEHTTTDKIDGYVYLMENLEAKAKIREAEYKAYKELIEKHRAAAKAARNRIVRLKEWMKYCMEAGGKDKIETDKFTVAVQKNGGVPAVIIPDNPNFKKWDEMFYNIVLEPNKEAIRLRHEHGYSIPEGVEVVTGTHIRIR